MDFPLIEKKWRKGINCFNIVYPNKKHGGVYNLGTLIVYNVINNLPGWVCKRVFLDEGKIDSKIIGFSLQYELDYFNLLKILDKNNIKRLNKDRQEVIIVGGPVVNTNPKLFYDTADILVFGDAEIILPKILKKYTKDKTKFLSLIKNIKGVFVPGLSKKFVANFAKNLDKLEYPLYQPLPQRLSKEYVFGNSFILEIERGCPFTCKFCQLPSYRKVRHRSLNTIKRIIDKGIELNKRNKVVLYTPSFVHPDRKKILKYLISKGLTFSVPSIRAELADYELLKLVAEGGQKTLTIAPESDEKLRFMLGKHVKDNVYLNFVRLARKLKFKQVKCYFMIGLPNENEDTLKNMVDFILKLKKEFSKLYVSINPFVPKPHTMLSEHKFDKTVLKKHMKAVKALLSKRKVKFKAASIKLAEKEYLIASNLFIPNQS